MFDLTPALFFCLAGLALVAAELLIFQLSVFWFLFIGAGALLASACLYLLQIHDWTIAVALFAVCSVVVAVLGYRPLKRWQLARAPMSGNDAIGQSVKVLTTISREHGGTVNWSGAEWHAELCSRQNEAIHPGEPAYIVELVGIRLIVASHAQ